LRIYNATGLRATIETLSGRRLVCSARDVFFSHRYERCVYENAPFRGQAQKGEEIESSYFAHSKQIPFKIRVSSLKEHFTAYALPSPQT